MDEKDLLKAELRVAREELARRNYKLHHQTDQPSLVVPPRDVRQARLKELTDEQLESHIERLERDLEDLDITEPNQLYRPTKESE